MRPLGMLPLTILVPCCEASACIPSSVVVLAYLSSFCFLLPTHMMLLLQNYCWYGQYACIRSVLASSDCMRPIGACASLPGFIVCLVLSPSFLGIPDARKTVPACLQLGPKKNWANAAASNASLAVCFSSFVFNDLLCLVGPRWLLKLP